MRLTKTTVFHHLSRALIVIAVIMMANALYMPGKALLAQVLLEHAWQKSMNSGKYHKPWPWADTKTLARLSFPAMQENYVVLEGSMGRTLAFAPGHMHGSSLPDESGHMVISAHRDSHFALLQHLTVGDRIDIQSVSGKMKSYRITNRRIVDSRKEQILLDHSQEQLTLITCYPFNAIQAGGPLRLRLDASIVQQYSFQQGQRSF